MFCILAKRTIMKYILITFLLVPFFTFSQIKSGRNIGTTEPSSSQSTPSKKASKGIRTVNCSEDLELDPGNKLIYHKKTQKPFSGTCVSYFTNGNLQRKASFKNGKDQDTAVVYYQNGSIKATISHVDGIENGTWAYWYPKSDDNMGEPQIAWANTYAMGSKEGQWYFFDKEGKPTKYLEYKGDVLDGECKYYYKGGDIKKTINYKGGKMDGEYTQYFKDSVVKSTKIYKNGKPDGKAESFYESSALKTTREYKNGKLTGLLTIYFENGQKKQEGSFKDGKEDGVWELYLEDGKNANTVLYDKGVLLKAVEYDRFGKPKNDLDLVELNNLLNNKKADDADGGKKKKKKKDKKDKEKKDKQKEGTVVESGWN